MRLDDETRTRLFIDVTLDVDPTGSTVELGVAESWHPCEWQGNPVKVSDRRWTRTARSTGYFAGPTVPAEGAVVLTAGQHPTQTRVSWPGGDSIVEPSTAIDVPST